MNTKHKKANSKLNTKKNEQKIKGATSNKEPSTTNHYFYGKFNDIFSLEYWYEKYKKIFKKRSLFIAVLLLNNGKYDMVTVVDESGYFRYKGKTYVIDLGFMREDVNTSLNMLFYYEGMSLPLKLDVDVDELTQELEKVGQDDIITAINPSTLQAFIKSEVIKQLISSGDLTSEMKSVKTLILVSLGISATTAYFVLKMNGIL
jgi:hypothetical protein